jgi:hypothetical protein
MRTLKLLVGSVVVYVVVACGSAVSGVHGQGDDGGTVDDATNGGSDDALGGGSSSGLMDALANPVRDAKAQALPPITATESCDKQVPSTNGAITYLFAEHAFPGKSVNDLAGVRTVLHYAGTIPNNPSGYNDAQGIASLRTGYATVLCGAVQGTSNPTSVTFILPQ